MAFIWNIKQNTGTEETDDTISNENKIIQEKDSANKTQGRPKLK